MNAANMSSVWKHFKMLENIILFCHYSAELSRSASAKTYSTTRVIQVSTRSAEMLLCS